MLCFVLYYSGALSLLLKLLTKFRKSHLAVILFYHRFSKSTPNPFQLPHLDINDFEKQLLQAHYRRLRH